MKMKSKIIYIYTECSDCCQIIKFAEAYKCDEGDFISVICAECLGLGFCRIVEMDSE